MNQEKIGKFIQENRKKKKLTQAELAEKLGVTDKSIGNWENGRNMPDLSLLKPLSEELDITMNELLSGERLKKEEVQDRFEENIINTILYSNERMNTLRNYIDYFIIGIGILLSITAMTMFQSDSSWGSIYSLFGCLVSLIGVIRFTRKYTLLKRISLCLCYFIIYIVLLFVIDMISVLSIKQIPRFCTLKEYFSNGFVCKNPIYNVYKLNLDTPNEYTIIDFKKEYTKDTIPYTPFNREKAGIDNIIKYKNSYVGNNSNDGGLISSLPLSEYGYDFQITSNPNGLIINYHITDWYINENQYVEKSLIYNSISIFSLIENVEIIEYNFTGHSYQINRKTVEENYPNYQDIQLNNLDKNAFNEYLEKKMSDDEFISTYFELLLIKD